MITDLTLGENIFNSPENPPLQNVGSASAAARVAL